MLLFPTQEAYDVLRISNEIISIYHFIEAALENFLLGINYQLSGRGQ